MRILGLDLGKSSLKAVEAQTTFRKVAFQGFHEIPIHTGDSFDSVLDKLSKLLTQVPDRTVIAIPTPCTTFRNLQFPTRDKKVIQSSVAFELEDEIPFDLDKSAYDYVLLGHHPTSTQLHISTTLKSYLTSLLIPFQNSPLDPAIVTSEAWAYYTLFEYGASPQRPLPTGPELLIDIGVNRTLFYLHWNHSPALIREIPWGGWHLTQGIQLQEGVSWEVAEQKKITQGHFHTPSDPLSDCLKSHFRVCLNEFNQIDLIARHLTHQTIAKIYLGGRTAQLPGLLSWIEKELNLSTISASDINPFLNSQSLDIQKKHPQFLLAFGLTLSQIQKNQKICINFRKNEFSKPSQTKMIDLSHLNLPLLPIATLLGLLLLNLTLEHLFYKSELQSVETQLEKATRSFFRQISQSSLKTYLNDPKLLHKTVHTELQRQQELHALFGPGRTSALNFLNQLSGLIPKNLVTDLIEFQYGQSPDEPFHKKALIHARLKFLLDDPTTAEPLESLLKGLLDPLEKDSLKEEEYHHPVDETPLKKWKISFSGPLDPHVNL